MSRKLFQPSQKKGLLGAAHFPLPGRPASSSSSPRRGGSARVPVPSCRAVAEEASPERPPLPRQVRRPHKRLLKREGFCIRAAWGFVYWPVTRNNGEKGFSCGFLLFFFLLFFFPSNRISSAVVHGGGVGMVALSRCSEGREQGSEPFWFGYKQKGA